MKQDPRQYIFHVNGIKRIIFTTQEKNTETFQFIFITTKLPSLSDIVFFYFHFLFVTGKIDTQKEYGVSLIFYIVDVTL